MSTAAILDFLLALATAACALIYYKKSQDKHRITLVSIYCICTVIWITAGIFALLQHNLP